jgi:hypothetical protein
MRLMKCIQIGSLRIDWCTVCGGRSRGVCCTHAREVNKKFQHEPTWGRPRLLGKGWSQRVDFGTVGKALCDFDFLILFYNVGLTMSTPVGAIVENSAPKGFFFYWVFFVPSFVGEGGMRSGLPCACVLENQDFWRCQHYFCGSCSFIISTHAVTDRQTDRHCSDTVPTLTRFQAQAYCGWPKKEKNLR